MKKLLTRLLLFVALVMFAFPSGAKDLYLQGDANVQDATSGYGWQTSPWKALKITAAADGNYYLRTFSNFKLSYLDSAPDGWDAFNGSLVYFTETSSTTSSKGDDINVGAKYVRLTPRTDGNFDVKRQSTAFVVKDLYIGVSDTWTNNGSDIPNQISASGMAYTPYKIVSNGSAFFRFYEKGDENKDNRGNWMGPSSDQQEITADGATVYTTGGNGHAFKISSAGTYYVNVSSYSGKEVKFTVSKDETVSDDLYVFSTNSGDWNNATGGLPLAVDQTILFSAAKPIYFVFGPKQKFDWNSSEDKALLYGAKYEDEVADGTTRTAQYGNSQAFEIGSGKWNLTVTEFVKGESVTFKVTRLGDADIPEDGYVAYEIYDETDKTSFELEWDINAGYYRGKKGEDGTIAALGANKLGHLFSVRARKNGATDFEKFGKPDGNYYYIQAGSNSVDLTKGAKPLYLNCNKGHFIKLDVKNGRYSEPSNVAFIETANTELAGKVYLVAEYLNDNYPSPAWELKPQPDGTYYLGEFAMRKNEHKSDKDGKYYIDIAVYDESGIPSIITVERKGFRVSRDYDRQPGRKCTATLDKNKKELTITAVPDESLASVMPYIGIVGKNFRQSTNMKTRHSYTKNNEERMGHTDDGWQEAYVEYGQFGSPLLDADGQAYYNTVWPPRNNILMQSYLGEGTDPLNVSSRDLTMSRDSRGIMTGAEWTTALQKENADEYQASYGLNDTGADKNGFKLVADRKYARYVVKNVWMMGEYKIWTGFAGKIASFGADWNRFRYWGPGGEDDKPAYNKRKESHKTFILSAETNNFHTEYLGEVNQKKNYAREYYRTMEFFIPMDDNGKDYVYLSKDGNEAWQPRFYVTKAVGGAKIDALAPGMVGSQKVGYAPTFENMSGYHVGGYTVTRYAYDANTDFENLLPCDRTRTATSEDAAKVVEANGVNYSNVDEFLNALRAGKTTFDSSDGKTKYVQDDNEGSYSPGRYIFRFKVKYVNDQNSSDTKVADVWSPYVEVFEEQGAVHIYHAQLVELPENHELAKQGYKYVTYSKERSRFHRVAVKVDDNDKPTELTRQESDAMIASLREVYLKTGVWTNKNLLLTEEPENFRGTKTGFNFQKKEGKADAAGAYTQVADLLNAGAPKIRNWYAWIDDNKARIENPETYKVAFTGELITINGTETTKTPVEKDNVTVHYPQFPLPYIDTPDVEVNVKLTDNTDEWPELYTATHEHLNIVEDSNNTNPSFQQSREDKVLNRLEVRVPVQLPNISVADGLRDAAYGKLKVMVNSKEFGIDTENLTGGRAYIVYDHQSPYDWLTYDNGEKVWKANPEIKWNTTGSEFTEDACAIEGISEPGIHDKDVSAALNPSFGMPSLSLDNNLKFSGEFEGPENGVYTYTGYLTEFKPGQISGGLLNANDLEDFGEDNSVGGLTYYPQYLCHVEAGAADGVSDVETVSQMVSGAGGKYKLVSAKVQADKIGLMTAFIKTLKLHFSRAYYFYSGDMDGIGEGTTHRNCGSRFEGLTGDFSSFHFGGDIHTDAPAAAPRQNAEGQPDGETENNLEPSTTGHSRTLYKGDNAFLFAPNYKTFDFSLLSDVQVGIDGIMDSDVRIVTGKGFIDLLGNEGKVYSTDGSLVYAGASRAEVVSGVYVVVLDGKTVKVFVK